MTAMMMKGGRMVPVEKQDDDAGQELGRVMLDEGVQMWTVGSFDTRKFDAIEMLATRMASMPVLPESLRGIRDGQGSNSTFTEFATDQIIGNCFLICTIADAWSVRGYRVDPFLLAQATSIVRGKLMFEGKVIHAALEAILGIELIYTFDNSPGDKLTVTATGRMADGREESVSGCVADWKTPQWGGAPTWPSRLRYRAAREWARAYKPGLMVGIIADDDEISMVEMERRANGATTVGSTKAAVRGRLEAGVDRSEGFGATGGDKRDDTPHDPATGELQEGGEPKPDLLGDTPIVRLTDDQFRDYSAALMRIAKADGLQGMHDEFFAGQGVEMWKEHPDWSRLKKIFIAHKERFTKAMSPHDARAHVDAAVADVLKL